MHNHQLLKLFGSNQSYADKVLAIANNISYWKLDESSGTNADDSNKTNNYDATYNGVTLAQIAGASAGMGLAPLWDGINDKTTAPSMANFSPTAGTISLWAKVSAVGRWTDGASRALCWFGVNTNNRFTITKHTVNNQLRYVSLVNGTTTAYNYTTSAPTGWFHAAYSWSNTGNFVAYFNGSQVDSQAWAGTWSAGTNTGEIGALTTSGVWWGGYLQHVSIYSRQLTASEILTLATAI